VKEDIMGDSNSHGGSAIIDIDESVGSALHLRLLLHLLCISSHPFLFGIQVSQGAAGENLEFQSKNLQLIFLFP